MKTLGVSFFSGGLQYSIFEKIGDEINLVERERCLNPAQDRIRESSEWAYGVFTEICSRHEIEKAGFKLHFNLMRKSDIYVHGAPIGVLGYFCSGKGIPLAGFTVRKIKGYQFLGLPKGTNTITWVKSNKNDGNQYWTNDAIYAVAVGLHRAMEK